MIEGSDYYCQKQVVSPPFEQAIARTREALLVEGFGILSFHSAHRAGVHVQAVQSQSRTEGPWAFLILP